MELRREKFKCKATTQTPSGAAPSLQFHTGHSLTPAVRRHVHSPKGYSLTTESHSKSGKMKETQPEIIHFLILSATMAQCEEWVTDVDN